ncbi:MAG: hypothetical protein ACH255_21190, partial [Candidatus Thiodiazotropha sp.]
IERKGGWIIGGGAKGYVPPPSQIKFISILGHVKILAKYTYACWSSLLDADVSACYRCLALVLMFWQLYLALIRIYIQF